MPTWKPVTGQGSGLHGDVDEGSPVDIWLLRKRQVLEEAGRGDGCWVAIDRIHHVFQPGQMFSPSQLAFLKV